VCRYFRGALASSLRIWWTTGRSGSRIEGRRGAAIAGRLGVGEDPLEGLVVDAVLAAGGALAQAVDEDATADLGPVLHVRVHPCASQPVPSVIGQTASIVGRWR
jgi:hypothetical protein